jgi:PST family polysaccharide transporter
MELKAVRGVSWTLLSFVGVRGLGLVTTLALARLLAPRDFGLLALAILATGLLGLLGELGLGATVVQRQDLGRTGLATAFALMLGTGVVAGAILMAAAPALAAIFDEPRLDGIVLALSPMVVLSGLGGFHDALLQRELEFRRQFVCRMAQAVVYAVVAIALAAAGAGVWSLVVGQLAGWAVMVGALIAAAPLRVRPALDRAAARDVLVSGRGFLLQGGLAFVKQNADYFAVGRARSAASLGFYSMSYRLGEAVYGAVAEPVAKVTFPGFARMHRRGESVAGPFCAVLRLVTLVAFPLGVVLSAAAEPLVRALLGETWLPAVGALTALGVWAMARSAETTLAWLLNAVGDSAVMGAVSAALLVAHIPALLLAAHLSGIAAVGWVMAASSLISVAVVAVLIERRHGVAVARQWRALRPIAIAGALSWGCTRAVAELTSGAPPLLGLVMAVGTCVAVDLLAVRAIDPTLLGEARRQALRSFGRASAGPGPSPSPAEAGGGPA